MSLCIFTVLNALLMSSATVYVGGFFWMKPVAIVCLCYVMLFQYSVYFATVLCSDLYGMLFVMHGLL